MKEAYYFSHDYDPTSDPKIQALISQFGATGYGLYWRVIEMMHSSTDHKLPHKNYIYIAIGSYFSLDIEYVKRFVEDCTSVYELFQSDAITFWSNRVLRNFDTRNAISESRSKAGKISAEKRKQAIPEAQASAIDEQNSTLVEQTQTPVEQNSTKERKRKEKKREEIKEKNNISLPSSLIEVESYIHDMSLNVDPNFFYEYYTGTNWTDKNGNPVKNWKLKCLTWSKKADEKGEYNRNEVIPEGTRLGIGEFFLNGQRCYGDRKNPVIIPNNIPPRPNAQSYFNRESMKWEIS